MGTLTMVTPFLNSTATSTSTGVTGTAVNSTGNTILYVVPYVTSFFTMQTSGATISGSLNVTLPLPTQIRFSTVLQQDLGLLQPLTGNQTLKITFPQHTLRSGLSEGAAAGIAIAAALAGALIAIIACIMLFKKKERRLRSQLSGAHQRGRNGNEKTVYPDNDPMNDLDRRLPQPLDDAAMKQKVENLFAQIDGHVESFYLASPSTHPGATGLTGVLGQHTLEGPSTILFSLKRTICQNIVSSMASDCPAERSFLPYGYTSLARQLKEPQLGDQINAMLWSRLRISVAYLLRDKSTTDQVKLDRAITLTLQKLNDEIQPFEAPGSTEHRIQDLTALLRNGADMALVLLSQPAEWTFEWSQRPRRPNQQAESAFVYFPSFSRVTDNKAKKLSSPICLLEARSIR